MTKTIKICDRCKKEVDWLYKIGRYHINGFNIEILPNNPQEICESCAREFVDLVNNFYKN
jgi:hypothetical protein